jgi:hypothetical protein
MTRRAAVGKVPSAQVVLVFVDNEGPPQKVKGCDPLQEIRIGAPPFYVAQVTRMAFSFRARRASVFTRRTLVIVLAGPQTALSP